MARPKRRKTKVDPAVNAEEHNMAKLVEELRAFDTFRHTFLESIQRDLAAGLTPEQVIEKHKGMVKLRTLTTAISAQDDGKALAAAKDILDRIDGKATEKKEIVHKLDKLQDEELDALLLSELEGLDVEDKTSGSETTH